MSDIFSEVDEDVRKDKSVELWSKYGKYVIAASVLVVAVTAAVVGWKNYTLSQAQTQGKQFEEAVAMVGDKKFDQATAAFGLLAQEGSSGYQALALLRQASALIAAGKGAEALEVYDALAANKDVGPEFSSVAGVLAGYYLINNGSTDDVRKRVEALQDAGTIWSASAKELLALSDLKDGKKEEAIKRLTELQQDATAPQGVKTRAEQMLMALKSN